MAAKLTEGEVSDALDNGGRRLTPPPPPGWRRAVPLPLEGEEWRSVFLFTVPPTGEAWMRMTLPLAYHPFYSLAERAVRRRDKG